MCGRVFPDTENKNNSITIALYAIVTSVHVVPRKIHIPKATACAAYNIPPDWLMDSVTQAKGHYLSDCLMPSARRAITMPLLHNTIILHKSYCKCYHIDFQMVVNAPNYIILYGTKMNSMQSIDYF